MGRAAEEHLEKNVFIMLVIFKGALIDLIYKRLTWI